MLHEFLAAPLAALSSRTRLRDRGGQEGSICVRKRIVDSVKCDEKDPPHYPYHPMGFKNWMSGHDIPSVRRGFEVYRQVCQTCHSLKLVSFKSLCNTVYPELYMKGIAASYDIEDGPNDQGEKFVRPGKLSDFFPPPYPNDEAARYSNGGARPPDLTVAAAYKHEGVDYIFSFLTGYRDPPYGVNLRAGLYYNTYFPGGACSMPPPLTEYGQVEYMDGTPATISQMAKDCINFLAWCQDPNMDDKKLNGLKMMSAVVVCLLANAYIQRIIWQPAKTRRVDFTKVRL